jgi:hypothetical protein
VGGKAERVRLGQELHGTRARHEEGRGGAGGAGAAGREEGGRTLFPISTTGSGLPFGSVTLVSISCFHCATSHKRNVTTIGRQSGVPTQAHRMRQQQPGLGSYGCFFTGSVGGDVQRQVQTRG